MAFLLLGFKGLNDKGSEAPVIPDSIFMEEQESDDD
jgi:hypothetical protein